jgi:hypothetical protein
MPNITSTALIVIAVAVLLYFMYCNKGSLHNEKSLGSEHFSEDSSLYSENSSVSYSPSSNLTYKMTNENSANSSTGYKEFSLANGNRDQRMGDVLEGFNSVMKPEHSDAGVQPMGDGAQSDNLAPFHSDGKPSNKYNSDELLPVDVNNSWFDVYNNVKVKNSNLITVYKPLGAVTQSGSNRNASHDFRGEPANPRFDVGPWGLSTIDGNPYSTGLCTGKRN